MLYFLFWFVVCTLNCSVFYCSCHFRVWIFISFSLCVGSFGCICAVTAFPFMPFLFAPAFCSLPSFAVHAVSLCTILALHSAFSAFWIVVSALHFEWVLLACVYTAFAFSAFSLAFCLCSIRLLWCCSRVLPCCIPLPHLDMDCKMDNWLIGLKLAKWI